MICVHSPAIALIFSCSVRIISFFPVAFRQLRVIHSPSNCLCQKQFFRGEQFICMPVFSVTLTFSITSLNFSGTWLRKPSLVLMLMENIP